MHNYTGSIGYAFTSTGTIVTYQRMTTTIICVQRCAIIWSGAWWGWWWGSLRQKHLRPNQSLSAKTYSSVLISKLDHLFLVLGTYSILAQWLYPLLLEHGYYQVPLPKKAWENSNAEIKTDNHKAYNSRISLIMYQCSIFPFVECKLIPNCIAMFMTKFTSIRTLQFSVFVNFERRGQFLFFHFLTQLTETLIN